MAIELNPTIIIGLGGQGTSLVNRIKKRSHENYRIIRDKVQLPLVQFFAIDSEFQSFTAAEGDDVILSPNERLELSVNPEDIKSVIKDPSKLRCFEDYKSTFIEKEVYKKLEVKGAGCGGWPIICRTNGVFHLDALYSALSSLMKNATDTEKIRMGINSGGFINEFKLSNSPIVQVLIFASLGGGTGRGLYELVVSLIRLLGQKYVSTDVEKVKIRLINIMPSVLKRTLPEVPNYIFPNTYTAFREIEHFIKNGYSFDNIYRCRLEELGINVPENVRFIDFAYLASIYNDRDGYAITSDYELYKDLLAEYFSDAIFKGFFNKLIAWESNISSERVSKGEIIELETGRDDRNLNYGRLAYFKIVFPTKLLLDYIKNYTLKEIVEDLIEGKVGTNKERINDFKRVLLSFGTSLSTISFEDPTKEYNTYNDAWVGAVENIFKQYQNMYNQTTNDDSSIDANVREHLKSALNYLSRYIEEDGFRGIKQYIESGEESLVNEINVILGGDDFSRIQKKKDIEKGINKVKEKIKTKYNELEREKNKVISEIEAILDKERNRGPLSYIIRQDRITPENLDNLRTIIRNFFSQCNHFKEYLDDLIRLKFSYKLLLELNKVKKIIDSNLNYLNKIKDEYTKNISDIITSTDTGYEKRLFLYSEKEGEEVFKYFNEKLNLLGNFYKEVFKDPQANKSMIMNKLSEWYGNKLKEHLNDIGKEIKYTVERFLFNNSEGNKLDLISRYFDMKLENIKDDAKRADTIASTVDYWLSLGSFLGRLDKDKIGGGLASFSNTYYIVMLPEDFYESKSSLSELIKDKIVEIGMRSGITISIGKNTSKENESIVILGLQSLLPLFLFEEMHELKDSYLEIEDTIVKIARHNSKFYYYFDEPVGKNWSISDEKDFNYIINLAYQLRAIKGDKENFEDKLLIAKLEGNVIEYASPKNHPNLTAFEFFENYSRYPTVIDEIEDAISTIYGYYVDKALKLGNTNETLKSLKEDYLPNFLTFENEKFLVIPEDFIPQIKKKLSEVFLNDIGVNFIKKYRKEPIDPTVLEVIKQKFGKKVYSNEEELKKAGLFIMPDIVNLPVVEYVLIYQYKDSTKSSKPRYKVVAANKDLESGNIKKYIFTSKESLVSRIKELLDNGIDENSIYIFSADKNMNAEAFLNMFKSKREEAIQNYTKKLKELNDIYEAVFSQGEEEDDDEIIIEWE